MLRTSKEFYAEVWIKLEFSGIKSQLLIWLPRNKKHGELMPEPAVRSTDPVVHIEREVERLSTEGFPLCVGCRNLFCPGVSLMPGQDCDDFEPKSF